jgi:hypothetical protein
MLSRQIALLAIAAASTSAFVIPAPHQTFIARNALLKDYDAALDTDIKREVRLMEFVFLDNGPCVARVLGERK